ncbi:MAG: oxidoreductase [Afipia felis]|nr:oxidoreductase [Afipia felis]
MRLRVENIREETPEVKSFKLAPASSEVLATFEPGSHISVHLAGNIIRQYSITNGPDHVDHYAIAVKKEPTSRGGSIAMHALKVGDEITVDPPRNNFPMSQSDGKCIFLGGGIGITPLLSMARFLSRAKRDFEFHLFARSLDFVPFKNELESQLDAKLHLGLVPPALNETLASLLSNRDPNTQVYICGPAPFMELSRQTAENAGWEDERVHLEYFSVATDDTLTSGESFDVELRRSGVTLHVNSDQTITEVMQGAGLEIPTSCEQGVCGTCVTRVLEGRVDHRDHYFSEAERRSGEFMTPCVSRALGKKIVLDI